MTFDSPLLLALAPLLAAVIGAVALVARRRRVARAAAWSTDLETQARGTGRWAPVVLGLAALAAAVGLAGPRGGRATIKTKTDALSVVLAIDISRSMLAEDTKPSRLQRAAREARRLVQDLGSDRVGLTAFAGRSYILSPLTLDGGAINLFLDALSPDIASQGGTGLAGALAQGGELLNASREPGDRVLVVFTDGEGHDSLSDVLAEARALREQQIRVVLVAEGGPRPVPIPLRDSTGAVTEYKTDDAGRTIETSRRDDVLQKVADAAEAALVPAELPDQAGAIRDLLAAFQRAPISASSTEDLLPLVWIPALIAALLLLLQTATRRTAALVGLGLICLGGRAEAQRPAPGAGDFAAGRMKLAAARLTRRLSANASDTSWYNAGTAQLAAGEYGPARKSLAEAAKSVDPDLRYRALYNAGVAALKQAAADTTRRDSLLSEASADLKDALSLAPSSARAKWNLELAQQHQPPPSGGGQKPQPPPPSGGQSPPDPSRGQTAGRQGTPNLNQSQAEQILNSVDREERDTRERRLSKTRTPVAGVKDW
jgi:Ca-activated chloride channel family protein